MEKFTTLTGVAAPLPIVNLDTDKIFPAIFLKTIKRTGLAQWLFHEIRFRPDGSEDPDFVLNQVPYRNAKILIGADETCSEAVTMRNRCPSSEGTNRLRGIAVITGASVRISSYFTDSEGNRIAARSC